MISVRQAGDLPPASFRFPVTRDTLALGYILPAVGRIWVFHPLKHAPAGRTKYKRYGNFLYRFLHIKNNLYPNLRNILLILFESQFAQLWRGWHSEEFCFESDTECLSRLPSYQAILEMGQAAIPLLVAKLADEQHFFALPLYDALQHDRELK